MRTYSDQAGQPFLGELGNANAAQSRPDMSPAERRATRDEFGDLSATEAAALARRTFGEEVGAPVLDFADPPDGDLVRTTGPSTALIRDDDTGETQLVLSSQPVREPEARGADPLDLTLKSEGSGFQPQAPLVDTRFTGDPSSALTFPGRNVSIGVATSSERDPRLTNNESNASYHELRPDSDLVLTARPQGAEIYLVLRSPDAPETFTLDVEMPAGATLREMRREDVIPADTAGPYPVAVFDAEDRPQAVIYPPQAHDAEGRRIPSRLSIEDGDLKLTVEHRDRLIAYPALADPEVYVRQNEYQPSEFAGWRHEIFRSQTSVQQNHQPVFGAALGQAQFSPGLYLNMPSNQWYFNGDFSELIFQAPTDTYITRGRLNWINHQPYYSSFFAGISNAANTTWESQVAAVDYDGNRGPNPQGPSAAAFTGLTRDFCYRKAGFTYTGTTVRDNNPAVCSLDGTDRNNFVVGLQVTSPSCCVGTGTNKASVSVNSVDIYLGDRYVPQLTSATPPSREWFDDSTNRTRTVTASATDRGLGLYDARLTGAATGGGTQSLNCTGHPYSSACPKSNSRTFSYTTGEGVNNLGVSYQDATGKRTAGGNWVEKVDRDAPQLVVTGDLKDLGSASPETSGRDLFGLEVNAADGRADGAPTERRVGVRDVTISIDDNVEATASSDPNCVDSCAVAITDFLIDTDQLSEGPHRVVVTATDRLGHTTTQAWTFQVARESFYATELAKWTRDTERKVDNLLPTSLSGPIPEPPMVWRDASVDALTEQDVNQRYDAISRWQTEIERWLMLNGATLLPPDLADPPTFEYSLGADADREFTRAIRDAFIAAKGFAVDPAGVGKVAITFDRPVTLEELQSLLPTDLPVLTGIALTGVFEPDGSAVSGSGFYGGPTSIRQAAQQFYAEQSAQAQRTLAELQDVQGHPDLDAEEQEDLVVEINNATALRDHLQGNRAFIQGIAIKTDLAPLLKSLLSFIESSDDARRAALIPDSIQSVNLLAADASLADDGVRRMDSRPSNAEQARSGTADATMAARFPTCTQRKSNQIAGLRKTHIGPSPVYFSPSRFRFRNTLERADGNHHRKLHTMVTRWGAAESLSWLCGDSIGDRGVEVEAVVRPPVVSTDPYEPGSDRIKDYKRWSDNWEDKDPEDNLREYFGKQTNWPRPLQLDDLAVGDGSRIFDKLRFPDFAIVSERSRLLSYRRFYHMAFITNEGETDVGLTTNSVQATRKADTTREKAYCYSPVKRGQYASCSFGETPACIATPPMGDIIHRKINWRDILGDALRTSNVRDRSRNIEQGDDRADKHTGEVITYCDPRPAGAGEH